MDIKEVMQVAAAIITSVGGTGAIVLGLSKWFGGVLANKLLESEKAEHSQELEKYKNELSEQLNKVKAVSDKELYITKVQYDNEYKIYMEIWEKLHKCIVYTLQLYPQGIENVPVDKKEMLEYQLKKYKKYAECYNDFSLTVDKYAPFYKKEFYEKFVELRKLCGQQGAYFDHFEIQRKTNLSFVSNRDAPMPEKVDEAVWIDIPKGIEKLKGELTEEIRDYLLNLRLKE